MLLLLLTLALILPLLAAMVLVSSPSGENRYMPAGVWQVYRLTATYRASSSGS